MFHRRQRPRLDTVHRDSAELVQVRELIFAFRSFVNPSRFSLLIPNTREIMMSMGAVHQLPMSYPPMGVLLTRLVDRVSPGSSISAIIYSYSYPADGQAGGELPRGGSQHSTA